MYESRFIKHLYLTSSRFEILSWLRVFISYIRIATVLIKIANRAAYFEHYISCGQDCKESK